MPIAQLLVQHREQVQSDQAGMLRRLFRRYAGADLTFGNLPIRYHWHVARQEHEASNNGRVLKPDRRRLAQARALSCTNVAGGTIWIP